MEQNSHEVVEKCGYSKSHISKSYLWNKVLNEISDACPAIDEVVRAVSKN